MSIKNASREDFQFFMNYEKNLDHEIILVSAYNIFIKPIVTVKNKNNEIKK